MLIDYIHTIFVTANFLTAELILHLASVSLRSDWLGDKLSPSHCSFGLHKSPKTEKRMQKNVECFKRMQKNDAFRM